MGYELRKAMDGSKCPKCSYIGRNFLILSDVLMGCVDCGCVFVGKGEREEIRKGIVEGQKVKKEEPISKSSTDAKEIIESFIGKLQCGECSFIAKTEYGLSVHKRKHARS